MQVLDKYGEGCYPTTNGEMAVQNVRAVAEDHHDIHRYTPTSATVDRPGVRSPVDALRGGHGGFYADPYKTS